MRKQLQLDWDRERRRKQAAAGPRVAEWTPARERHEAQLSDAWVAFLASERERRGNPTWQPTFK